MPSKRSYEYVKSVFEDAGYTLLDNVYKNNKTPMRYICPNHPDKVQTTRFNDISTGHGCYDCGRERINLEIQERAIKQRSQFEIVKKEFEKRGYVISEEGFKGTGSPIKYTCNKHPDRELWIKYFDLTKRGGGCTYCGVESRKIGIERARQIFESKGYVLLEDEYVNSRTPMMYICNKHPEEEMSITLGSIQGGHGCWKCGLESISGANSPHYKHDKPLWDRDNDRRYDAETYRWRRRVFERDSYSCVACGETRSGGFAAHHKDAYHWCVERRYDVSNGATLCKDCHREFHDSYGYAYNTEQQFTEWINARQTPLSYGGERN